MGSFSLSGNVGNINAKGNINAFASEGGGLTLGNLVAGKDVSVGAVQNSSLKTGNITAGRNAHIESIFAANTSTGNINAKGNIDFLAYTGSITETGDLCAGKSIVYESENIDPSNFLQTGNIKAGENFTVFGIVFEGMTSKVESVKTGDINVGKNVSITAQTISTGNIKAGGCVKLDDDFNIVTKNINAGQNVEIKNNGASVETENIYAGKSVYSSSDNAGKNNIKDIFAGKDINIDTTNGGEMKAGNLYGVNVNISANAYPDSFIIGDIKAKGNVSIGESEANIRVGNVSAGSDINVFAFEDRIQTGNLCAKRNISLANIRSLAELITENVNAGKNVYLEGDIDAKSIKAGGKIIRVND